MKLASHYSMSSSRTPAHASMDLQMYVSALAGEREDHWAFIPLGDYDAKNAWRLLSVHGLLDAQIARALCVSRSQVIDTLVLPLRDQVMTFADPSRIRQAFEARMVQRQRALIGQSLTDGREELSVSLREVGQRAMMGVDEVVLTELGRSDQDVIDKVTAALLSVVQERALGKLGAQWERAGQELGTPGQLPSDTQSSLIRESGILSVIPGIGPVVP